MEQQKVWVKYRSTLTGKFVTLQFDNIKDVVESLLPLGITKFEVVDKPEQYK